MTQKDLFQQQTPETPSSQPDIPASPSVLPESREAQRMTATSGRTLAKLFHAKDPLGAFSKMFMVTSHWASTKCLLTWKPKVTPQGRLLCQLAVSTPRTDEIGSGSSQEMWATPRTTDGTGGPRKLDERGRRISHSSNLVFGANLSDQVRLWPTPKATDGSKGSRTVKGALKEMRRGKNKDLGMMTALWPIPTTRDHKGGYQGGRIRNGKVSMDTLDVAVQHTDNQQKTGGQLNPMFVEWLMGYPKGWTELKD